MKKITEKLKSWKPTRRKIMQLYFALLFNANIQGFFTGKIYSVKNASQTTKQFCAPGINCYSCPGAVAACPLGSLQGAFSSSNRSTIYYVVGSLLLYAIVFGRMICGWLCPFGLLQELLYKIHTPKLKKSPVTRILSFLKYVILVFFVLIVPITYAFRATPLPAFCKYICPAGTIEGGLLLLANKANESRFFPMLSYLFTWKFLLMVSIVVASVFIFRVFCRFICPLGGLYGLFNKLSFFGVQVDDEKCIDCNLCVAQCKCDIKHVGDQECIACGECIDICPTKAISWKGSKIFLKANAIPTDGDEKAIAAAKKKQETKRLAFRIVAAAVMLAVLIGAVCYYWNPDVDIFAPATEATAPSGDQPVVGSNIGNLCPGDALEIYTQNGLTEQTIDPSSTGKVTVVNFWGTWCGGCVAELPYFSQIAADYADDVVVIAVSTSYSLDEVADFITDTYLGSKIIFAGDAEDADGNESYYTALGGQDAYPYTVILDENGVILFHTFESMNYATLQAQIEAALNN